MNRDPGRLLPLRREGIRIDEMSDDGLIAACAAGDRAARAALFERHVGGVHRFIARLTAADADAVDDLVQQTFLAAFRAAARFHNGSQVRTWLCGIAANLVRTYARGEIRRKSALSSVAAVLATPRRPLSEQVEQARLVARLEAALPELRHDQRVAFVMVDVEGMRGVDAAAALGVPEGTLWRRLHEARAALRGVLEGPR
jgi:RNA polymerase sigma-70 factor (ECF subfamily)